MSSVKFSVTTFGEPQLTMAISINKMLFIGMVFLINKVWQGKFRWGGFGQGSEPSPTRYLKQKRPEYF